MNSLDTYIRPLVKPEVTLYTTCKDRVGDLRHNFLANIADNPHPEVQFVLLNYSSRSPDVDLWVRENLGQHIETGKVVYGLVRGHRWWAPSHPKNVAFRLGDGKTRCNVDADNRTSRDFGAYLAVKAAEGTKLFFSRLANSTYGRIAVNEELFAQVGGYDESFVGYGWEDVDLEERIMALGHTGCAIPKRFLVATEQTPAQRSTNYHTALGPTARQNEINKTASQQNLADKIFVANQGWPWGSATVEVNWRYVLSLQ